MDTIKLWWEKARAVLISQRFQVAVVTFVIAAVVVLNVVVPAFWPDWCVNDPGVEGCFDLPDEERLAADFAAAINTAITIVGALISILAWLGGGLIQSYKIRPPMLGDNWDQGAK